MKNHIANIVTSCRIVGKRGIFRDVFGIKNNLKTTAHIQPYYYSKNIFTAAYFGMISAVLTKFTAVGLPERFKSPA